MSSQGLWGLKTLCIVTGASQGIGKTIAIDFSKKLASGSTIVLIARSQQGLNSTKELIESSSKGVSVLMETQDLSKPDMSSYVSLMKGCMKEKYDSYMFVHNAGTEGNSKLTAEMSNLEEWQQYMNLNLFSMAMLTSAFLSEVPTSEGIHKTMINITSLCAVQAFSGLGYYCIGKASREMYMKALALENPSVKILNYSPGPVNTDMITRVIDSLQVDETKEIFTSLKKNSTLLNPSDTIAKLIGILESNSFTTGDRVDYFDRT